MNQRWRDRVIALILTLATTGALSVSHRDVGYVRDEGIYFVAGRSYARWYAQLARTPGKAMRREVRDRAFSVNHEHPALMKTLGGLSGLLLAQPTKPVADERVRTHDPPVAGLLPWMPEGAAMRLPAQLLAGLAVALLYLGARRRAPAGSNANANATLAALLAAGFFILLPRVWFHAGLDCFDVAIATLTLAVAFAYHRSLGDWRWGLAVGPLLGVAISIKHNALFLPVLLGLHYLVCLLLRRLDPKAPTTPPRSRPRALLRLAPLPFVSMATLAPLVFVALWPWLWSDPIARVGEYFAFHLHHSWYNIEFLGVNYNRPPMPMSLPAVITWATVPTTLLALAAGGVAVLLARDLGPLVRHYLHKQPSPGEVATDEEEAPPPTWSRPIPLKKNRREGLLIVGLGLFPIVLISSPNVPVFGGSKHWITALPFLALAAATCWSRLWSTIELPARWRLLAPALALALVLTPGAWSTVAGHPYNLSQYAPLVGGARGAADLGLNRGFWGHAVLGLLPELSESPGGARARRIYLHDVHELARQQYEREGRWPADLVPGAATRSQRGLLFYERHMLTYETELWRAHGTAPAALIELHDVPLTSLYARE